MNEARVRIHDEDGVRLLTLNRPEKKNAFDVALSSQLWSAIEAASVDDDVRVLAVTGAGDYFSAGADLGVFLNYASLAAEDVAKVGRLFEPLRACQKPTVAIVQGPCVGMGVTILPHFDLVYAADHATFTTPFVKLGLVLEYGSSHTLARRIGPSRAKEMIFRARPLDAPTAAEWGLVTRLFGAETLLAEAMTIAKEIAAQPPRAIAHCKTLLDEGLDSTFDEAIEREDHVLESCYGSEENVAAVEALLARMKK